ncbi:uncharacterized protein LOC130136053 [Syzygium oleosum]|uniref:uncharacterized protein LOC130136053 n=1 Tax=Syzygium oleosum TaxID=219896 RepID=UPI0024B8DD24|nr:uncharacterized protein LOC130136053 [Syzygium oleosum]
MLIAHRKEGQSTFDQYSTVIGHNSARLKKQTIGDRKQEGKKRTHAEKKKRGKRENLRAFMIHTTRQTESTPFCNAGFFSKSQVGRERTILKGTFGGGDFLYGMSIASELLS